MYTHTHTLQHTSTHCNTLQRTATQCNTLQHAALAMYSQIRSIMTLLKRRSLWMYCTYAYTHIHTHTHKVIEVCSGVKEGESGFIYTHTHTHSLTYACIQEKTFMETWHIRTHMHAHTHTYTHTHKHT